LSRVSPVQYNSPRRQSYRSSANQTSSSCQTPPENKPTSMEWTSQLWGGGVIDVYDGRFL